MSDIIKKVLREGTVPMLTDEGLKGVIGLYSRGDIKVSRELKLSTYEPPKTEQVNKDYDKKYGKKILSYLLQAIKKEIEEIGIDEYERTVLRQRTFKVEGYGEYIPQKTEVLNVLSMIDEMSIDEILENSEFARVLLDTNAKFNSDHIGDIDVLPYTPTEQKTEHSSPYDYRLYFNPPYGETRSQFITEYIKKCIDRKIPYNMKGFEGSKESKIDSMVFYTHEEYLADVLEILEEIKTERPELVEAMGTPITSGVNYENYYCLAHKGRPKTAHTFNDIVQYSMSWAMSITCAQYLITEKFEELSSEDKSYLQRYLNFDCADFAGKNRPDKIAVFSYSNFKFSEFFSQSALAGLASNPEFISALRENYLTIQSLYNFKDTEHKNMPPCLSKEFFEHLEYKEKDFAIDYTDTTDKSKVEENSSVSIKTSVSKEKYLRLLKAGEVKLKMELGELIEKECKGNEEERKSKMAEIQGKSKEELREMLFARIELNDESIIDILSGESEQLYQFVDLLGKDDEYEHRRDYEERFIKLMGIDRVIDAVYTVRDKDAQLGRNRKWKFRDSLRTVRLERGQAIFESEEFQKLKTREQRNEFIKNFSEHAKYDVEEYYDLYGKSSGYSK